MQVSKYSIGDLVLITGDEFNGFLGRVLEVTFYDSLSISNEAITTYTYDWGMVTDLGRRNISRMCADLGVENISNIN